MSLKIVGAENIAKKLAKFGEHDLREARVRRLKESAIIIEGQAKKEAPVDKGILRKYIRSHVNADHALIYNNIAYALAVHEGTKPYTITAKGKALYRKGAKHPVRSVRHPGIKANPFFTRAVENKQSRIQERFAEIIDLYIQKM